MQQSELITYYLDVFLTLMTTPLGAAALLAAIAMVAAAATIPRSRWVFLTLAVYFATLPLINTKAKYLPLAFPLEQFRAFARPMIYFFTAILLLPLLTSERGWRRNLLSWPLIFFFVFEVCICIRLIAFGAGGDGDSEGVLRGLLSLGSYVLLLLTLGLAVSRWLQSFEDLYKLVWVLSCLGGAVVLGTCYQLVINRTPIVWNSRLTGITGNPQFLGIIIAYTLPFTCHLLTRSGGRKWIHPLLIAQITLTVVLLIWTGSRTGALSTAAGLAVAFHRRLGRFLVAAVVVGIAVLLVMPYFQGSSEIASRLLSTVDTRAGVWPNLIKNIRENFWFGAARDSFETQESSYLSILGQFGIFGSLPFLISAAALVVQLVQMRQMRRYLGSEAPIVDIVWGVWTAVAITAFFESLLVGVITFPVLMIYLFFGMNTFLLDWSRGTEAAGGLLYEEDTFARAA